MRRERRKAAASFRKASKDGTRIQPGIVRREDRTQPREPAGKTSIAGKRANHPLPGAPTPATGKLCTVRLRLSTCSLDSIPDTPPGRNKSARRCPKSGLLVSARFIFNMATHIKANRTCAGRAVTANMPIDMVQRYGSEGNAVQFKFYGSADNPIISPSASIDWDFSIGISANGTSALNPKWLLLGNGQDGFSASEIYARDSDGTSGEHKLTTVHQDDPSPLGRTVEDLLPWPLGADEPVIPAIGAIP